MRRTCILILLLALLLPAAGTAQAGEYRIAKANETAFLDLLSQLQEAYENPAEGDWEAVEATLETIRAASADDYDVARSVADHWKAVYLDPEYELCVYGEGETAEELEATEPIFGQKHAFVVLGYELKDGKMQPELKGRCRAAAAAARSYPDALLICSGGATGSNNPDFNSEAGLMKQYLVFRCGIESSRILTDTRAMSTLQNAENTFAILRKRGIETITVVTSTYHQRWGQVLYNAMSALYEKRYGFSVRIVGNYCYDTEPDREAYRHDARFAIRQLTQMLGLPDSKK